MKRKTVYIAGGTGKNEINDGLGRRVIWAGREDDAIEGTG
jgi:hypothetical protein